MNPQAWKPLVVCPDPFCRAMQAAAERARADKAALPRKDQS